MNWYPVACGFVSCKPEQLVMFAAIQKPEGFAGKYFFLCTEDHCVCFWKVEEKFMF